MSIEIRKALAGDAEELLDLMRILGKETDNLTFGEEGFPFTVEEEIAYIEKVNSSNTSAMFVALDSNSWNFLPPSSSAMHFFLNSSV